MSNGLTPIFIAAAEGHEDVIAILKAAGVNEDTPMTDGRIPVAPILMSLSQDQLSATKKQDVDTTKRCFFCGY